MTDHDRVERWLDLDQDRETVWAAIGAFASIADWHPAVDKAEIVEIDGDTHRHLTLADGAMLLERLEEVGDHLYRYRIIEGPLPVSDYLSTFTVAREGTGCRVFWSSTFTAEDPQADEIIEGIYEAGLRAIRDRFA